EIITKSSFFSSPFLLYIFLSFSLLLYLSLSYSGPDSLCALSSDVLSSPRGLPIDLSPLAAACSEPPVRNEFLVLNELFGSLPLSFILLHPHPAILDL